jgi:hypothetical protein
MIIGSFDTIQALKIMFGSSILDSNFAAQLAKANRLSSALTLSESITKSQAHLDWISNDWAKAATGFNLTNSALDIALKSLAASTSKIDPLIFQSPLLGYSAALEGISTGLDVSIFKTLSQRSPLAEAAARFSELAAMPGTAMQAALGMSNNINSWLNSHVDFAKNLQSNLSGVSEIVSRLQNLNGLQQDVFSAFRSQSTGLPQLSANWVAQSYNTQHALGSLFTQLAENALDGNEWAELDLSSEVGEGVFSLGNEIVSSIYLTKEALSSLLIWVARMYVLLVVLPAKKAVPFAKVMLHLLGIVSDIITVGTCVYAAAHPSVVVSIAEFATKEELQQAKHEVATCQQAATQVLAEKNEARVVTHTTSVCLKPRGSALVISKLFPNAIVVIIQTYNEWAYIRFQDSDSQPAHGWIRKKYLGRIK